MSIYSFEIFNRAISLKFLVYKRMEDAMLKHSNADVLVNFASLRSAYDSTIETLNYPQVRLRWSIVVFYLDII